MQGSVKVESNEVEGSVFTCELLLQQSPDSKLALPEKALHNKRVLIIENNQSCADIIKRQLITWKLDADIITSLESALPILTKPLEKMPYDLLMINQQIPGLHPLEFVKEVRSNPDNKNLKIMCPIIII